MLTASKRFKLLSRFRKDDDGSASIEFVMWMPTMMFIMMLAIDASLLFMSQSNYGSISRDAARLVARHAITVEEAEAYAEAQAVNKMGSPDATVSVTGQSVTVMMTAPAASLTAFNLFNFVSSYQISAATTQAMEPK